MKAKVDPVESGKEEKVKDVMDVNGLTIKDLKPISERAATRHHPFEGYPKKKENIFNVGMVSMTDMVALDPTMEVFQDPSNKNVAIGNKVVDLENFHSRFIVDYDNGGINTEVVFDRKLRLSDGTVVRAAYVPSDSVRAQIVFKITPTGKIKPDTRYRLFDTDQEKRLRQCFDMAHYQMTGAERNVEKHYAAEQRS